MCTITSMPVSRPAKRRIADVDDAPDDAGQIAAAIIDRDHPAEPVGLREPRGQREPEIVRGACHCDDRQVIAVGVISPIPLGRTQLPAPPARTLAPASSAPPLANLANSVAHREALLG